MASNGPEDEAPQSARECHDDRGDFTEEHQIEEENVMDSSDEEEFDMEEEIMEDDDEDHIMAGDGEETEPEEERHGESDDEEMGMEGLEDSDEAMEEPMEESSSSAPVVGKAASSHRMAAPQERKGSRYRGESLFPSLSKGFQWYLACRGCHAAKVRGCFPTA